MEEGTVTSHLRCGIAGGMLGLAAVGTLEALAIVARLGSLTALEAVPYALVVYGVVGAIAGAASGVGLGLLAGWTGKGRGASFGLHLATWFFLGAAVIGRFLLIRDVFGERVPPGLWPKLLQLGGLAVLAVLALGLYVTGRLVARRWIASPRGAAALLLVFVGVTLGAAMVPARWRSAAPPSAVTAPADAPPIILIVVDTLRADYLSAYGGTRVATPHLDGLARNGLRFAAAISQASWTRASFASIFTSLYPSSHGAVGKSDVLADSVTTLAEALRSRGYRTVGLANNANITEAFNFQQGFESYEYLAPELFFFAPEAAAELLLYRQARLVRERFLAGRTWVQYYYQPADVVTDHALAIVRREQAQPFFLFVHYMDPHDPYFTHPYDGHGVARVSTPFPDPARAAELAALYAGEVAYLDEHIGRLLAGLRALGLYDRSVVLLTADHGEEFYEHQGWWHGTTLYEEQIRVPLIVKPPGGGGGRVVTSVARGIDIAPTLLTIAGAAIPAEMQGRVLDLRRPDAGGIVAAYAEEDFEGNIVEAVRGTRWKLIHANVGNPRGQPERQLFDLEADPGEQRNRYEPGSPEVAELTARLEELEIEADRLARATEQRDIDGATEQRLKALGYVD